MNTRFNMQKALAHYANIIKLQEDQNYLVAEDMARLDEIELEGKDLYRICCKLRKAAYLSTEPFLHQERLDAVRYLLEYGLNTGMSNRFSYLPKLTHAQAKDFLLSASQTEVCLLVDIVASENRDYYSVEHGIDMLDTDEGASLLNTLTSIAAQKQPLENRVHLADKDRECRHTDPAASQKQKRAIGEMDR